MNDDQQRFPGWLIWQSAQKGLSVYEYLILFPNFDCFKDESDDWGSSSEKTGEDTEALDWGLVEDAAQIPTTVPCDTPVLKVHRKW